MTDRLKLASHMLELPLHTGHEHPTLIWVLIPSYFAFLAGIAIGAYADRIRRFIRPQRQTTE